MHPSADAVQSPTNRTLDAQEFAAVKTLIVDLISQGERNRSALACRVWQTHPACSSSVLTPLLAELLGENEGGSGAATSAPSENKPPERYAYQNSRVSEVQELQESQESQEGRSPLTVCAETNQEEDNKKEPTESPKASIPSDPIEAAIDLAAQIAKEQWTRRVYEREAIWVWPFRLARRLLHWRDTLTDAKKEHAVCAFFGTLQQRWATSNALEIDHDELWLGFLEAWERVRMPEGLDTLAAAIVQTRRGPLRFTAARLRRLPNFCVEVAGIAYYLTGLTEDGIILLPQERLAEWLGVQSQSTISRAISQLVRHHVLEVVSDKWSKVERQAKTYRLIADEDDYEIVKNKKRSSR